LSINNFFAWGTRACWITSSHHFVDLSLDFLCYFICIVHPRSLTISGLLHVFHQQVSHLPPLLSNAFRLSCTWFPLTDQQLVLLELLDGWL
jgi:hypothetical protein